LAAVTASNGKIYAIGGDRLKNDAVIGLRTVEEYDPSANTWTRKASMPVATWHTAAATASNGKIYVIGGVNYPALTGGAFKDPKTISTVCSARDDDIEYIYGSLPR
jgi:N-acetylneuraminic acid mutarotase